MNSRYREESAKQGRDSAECHERLQRRENTNAAQNPVIRLVVLTGEHHEGELEFWARSPAVMEPLYEILNVGAPLPPMGSAFDRNQDSAEDQGNRKDNGPSRCRKLPRHCDGDGPRRQEHRQYSAGKTQ